MILEIDGVERCRAIRASCMKHVEQRQSHCSQLSRSRGRAPNMPVIRASCMMKLSRHLPVASLMLVVVSPMRHRSFIFVKTTGEERTTACALMSKV